MNVMHWHEQVLLAHAWKQAADDARIEKHLYLPWQQLLSQPFTQAAGKFRCPPTHLEAQSQSLWQDGMARGARRLGGFTAAVPLRAVLRQGACRAVSAQNQGIKAFQLSTAPPGACRAAPLAGSRVARTGPHNRQSSDLGWLPPVGRECRSGLRGTGGPLGWHRRCGCHQ